MFLRLCLLISFCFSPQSFAVHNLKVWYKYGEHPIKGDSVNELYQWASIAKPVTYAIFSNLAYKNKLSINMYESCVYGKVYDASNLLNHRSSLNSLTTNIFSKENVIKEVESALKEPPHRTNNTIYSNLNYYVIGKEIECLTNKDFSDIRKQYWSDWTKSQINLEYSKKYPYLPELTAAGNLVTTPAAIINFANNVLKCLISDTCINHPIPSDKCQLNTYCNGFYIQSLFGNKVFHHKGNLKGLETLLLIDPKHQLIVVLHLTHNSDSKLLSTESFSIILSHIYREINIPSNNNVY